MIYLCNLSLLLKRGIRRVQEGLLLLHFYSLSYASLSALVSQAVKEQDAIPHRQHLDLMSLEKQKVLHSLRSLDNIKL